ncbi:MAG: hypothetical protein COA73_11930 [Candidatus Hydrogenedentota bacterium]|nr:MAG: hypothetical protein COA73_11930 [Candidatus Hydrogenedentota bacterium]
MKFKSVYHWGIALGAAAILSTGASAQEQPTYTKDIAPILNNSCVECHRPGQVGPMSLLSYKEVRPWVKSIRKNVADKKMPPWHVSHSKVGLMNDRSLTQEEINTIVKWADSGAPRGKRSDLPPKPEFSDGDWKLGEPDFIVTLPEVEIAGDGPDMFKDLPGKVNLKEDRWIKAIEILPGNSSVVHHVLAFQIQGFGVDPIGGWMGAWAAGTEPMVFPEKTGRIMKKGHSLIADMHYHPSGEDATDQTRIGLHFADEKDIEKELTNLWVMNTGFMIPAGADNHEVRAQYSFQQDGKILGFAPHMHYRGKDFSYTATYPDGTSEVLFAVDNYDFNWQTNYVLEEPIAIPEGTIIEAVAHYDNSTGNPANPDATIDITFGDESYDEMMIGFIDYVVDDGISPYTSKELRQKWTKELLSEFPNDTYSVYVKDPTRPTVIYLPVGGEGVISLGVNNNITKCRIMDVTWNGTDFEGTCDFTGGETAPISGSIDRENGRIEIELTVNNNGHEQTIQMRGALAASYDAAKEKPISTD